jgi:uncharacterized protein (TIGR03083 family)
MIGRSTTEGGSPVLDTWQMIAAERAALVASLEGLGEADFDRPSLCAGWTVRDVVGHIVATAGLTPPAFLAGLAGSGFSFDRMVANKIKAVTTGRTGAELVEALRAKIDSRKAPPGPAVSWLGETIVHGEDVFRALDGHHDQSGYRDHPIEHVLAVADFYRGSNLLIGAKRRIDGVTLRATDANWTCGSGPELTGPAIALLLAMTGRKAALDDLAGDGVAVLRSRP